MNTPISTALAQAIIDQGDAWFEGGLSKCEAGEITAALTELLALRAEVERLRAVEQAARAHLDNSAWRSPCHGCSMFFHSEGHSPNCTQAKLAAALDATLANLSAPN